MNRRSFLLGTTTMVAAASMPSLAPAVTCTVEPAMPAPTYEQIASVLQDAEYERFCQEMLQRIVSAYGLSYEEVTRERDIWADSVASITDFPR